MTKKGEKIAFKPIRRKYGNIPSDYKGRMYQSKKEAYYAQELDLLKRAHEITDWEAQVDFPLYVNGHLITTYRADFVITKPGGKKQVHEVKSPATMTPLFRVKWKLMQALHGDEYDLIIVQ